MLRGMTPQLKNTMDFQLHQLSTSNLASIFNAAFMDADAPEDTAFCSVKGDSLHLLVIPENDNDLIRFSNFTQLPDGLKEEDESKFFEVLNEYLNYVKVFRYRNEKDEKDRSIIFEYVYPVFKGQSISSKTLVQLVRTFEKTVLDSARIYFHAFETSRK